MFGAEGDYEEEQLNVADTNFDCDPSIASNNLTETILRVSEDYPLVGFHGTTDGEKLISLGLIWFDSGSDNCIQPMTPEDQQFILENMSEDDIYDMLSTMDQ